MPAGSLSLPTMTLASGISAWMARTEPSASSFLPIIFIIVAAVLLAYVLARIVKRRRIGPDLTDLSDSEYKLMMFGAYANSKYRWLWGSLIDILTFGISIPLFIGQCRATLNAFSRSDGQLPDTERPRWSYFIAIIVGEMVAAYFVMSITISFTEADAFLELVCPLLSAMTVGLVVLILIGAVWLRQLRSHIESSGSRVGKTRNGWRLLITAMILSLIGTFGLLCAVCDPFLCHKFSSVFRYGRHLPIWFILLPDIFLVSLLIFWMPSLRFFYGRLATRFGKSVKAIADAQKRLYDIGLLIADGKTEQGLIHIQSMPQPSAGTNTWFDYKIMLARCFAAANMRPLALSTTEEIEVEIKNHSTDLASEMLYSLGMMYEELKMPDKAIHLFTEIAKRNLGYKDIQTRLKALHAAGESRKRKEARTPPPAPPTDRDGPVTGAQTIVSMPPMPEPGVTGAQTIAVKFDRYDIENEIGRGGMGVVCRAFDRELERSVALKLLPDELNYDPRAIIALKKEARIATEMSHPNIVRVYDIGEEGGKRFISMELVNGPNLMEALLEKESFDDAEIRLVARAVCAALGYAHGRRVVHKDVKPANVMVDFGAGAREECIERWKRDGAAALRDFAIKMTDFGIARTVKDTMTRISGRTTSGTLLYMSPQSLQGRFPAPADDVYSLGCTFYELATGYPPFHTGDITYQHINVRPEDARNFAADLSEEMNAIIMRCLEKDPAKRFADAGEIEKLL